MKQEDIVLSHIGTKRHSGRYPWGSGQELLSTTDRLRAEGLSELEIASALEISTKELRELRSIIKGEMKESLRLSVVRDREKGMSLAAIATERSLPLTTVADLVKPTANLKFRMMKAVADLLAKAVEKFTFVDVGRGVEHYLNTNRTILDKAIQYLVLEKNMRLFYLKETQLTTGKETSIRVLAPASLSWKEVNANKAKISLPGTVMSDDFTDVSVKPLTVRSVPPGRVKVVYNSSSDGLIELRDIPELSLGSKNYAQVRIAVGDNHYLKGMAIRGINMPPDVDIVFHTSKGKPESGNQLDVMKEQDHSAPNPFGAALKPSRFYVDPKTGKTVQSALNVIYEEGDWEDWDRSLSAQFLSKQTPALAKKQLAVSIDNIRNDFDDILSVTQPTLRRKLLLDFAEQTDAEAEQLTAAALPKQRSLVILPDPTLKPNEVYCPSFNNGEVLALIRYPHAGPFEIPIVTVNNKSKTIKQKLAQKGSPIDAVVMNPSVASVLSGADFDGDSVVAIPYQKGLVVQQPYPGLKNFNPRTEFRYDDPNAKGVRLMTKKGTGLHMGNVTNLITDMTIAGAPPNEIERAVKHSMVVIDAHKHKLNYKESARVHGISGLKKKYQGSAQAGASTLITKAKSPQFIPEVYDHYDIDPVTGDKVYIETGRTYFNVKKGTTEQKMTRLSKMALEPDARNLSSGTVIEGIYASHANACKDIARKARLAYLETDVPKEDPIAAKKYAAEVESLSQKLVMVRKHQPLERKAQVLGNEIYKHKLNEAGGELTRDEVKKLKTRSLALARQRLGTDGKPLKKPVVEFTEREWEAVQANAISPTHLSAILANADGDTVRSLATPRTSTGVSAAKTNRSIALMNMGYTNAEISVALGIPVSAVLRINKDAKQ